MNIKEAKKVEKSAKRYYESLGMTDVSVKYTGYDDKIQESWFSFKGVLPGKIHPIIIKGEIK